MIEEILTKLENLPEIQKGKEVWQNKFHKYNVFDHTMKYVEYLKTKTDDPNILVAGLLHDIGKPVVATPKVGEYNEEGKQYHKFTNHEKVGGEMVKEMNPELFQQHGLDQEKIAGLVTHHYTPMLKIKELRKAENLEEFEKTYQSLQQSLDETGLDKNEIMLMFLADSISKGGSSDQPELVKVYELMVENKGSMEEIHELQKATYKQ